MIYYHQPNITYQAHAELSHGEKRMSCKIEWATEQDVKEGKYITLKDYKDQYINGPKRLWKIKKLSNLGIYNSCGVTFD